MPNPYQNTSRRWPDDIKRKCFDMWMLGYTAPEISKKYGPGCPSIYRWQCEGSWSEIRDSVVIDYRARAEELLGNTVTTLVGAIKVADKVIRKIDRELDAELQSNTVTEQQDSSVPKQQSHISAKELSDFASALKDASDVLLRVFNK